MVIGAFPAAKLGTLLLRQISKPIVNYIITRAKSSPIFRKYICMPPAQFYNWCELKTKMWILNMGKPINIPVLNESMAIELGANLLGEAIIFTIAASVLLLEYNRSSRKEAAKEKVKEQEMDALNSELRELFFQVEEQGTQIKELLRIVYNLESQVVKKPYWAGSNKSDGSQDDPKDVPPSEPSLPIKPSSSFNQKTNDSELIRTNKSTNLLMNAIQRVEDDYFTSVNKQNELGILVVALNYFYKDVYRVPISM